MIYHEKNYAWNSNLGFAYTCLISHKAKDINRLNLSGQIIYADKDVKLLQFGTTYHFTQYIDLDLKGSLPVRIEGLSRTLTARMIYNMIRINFTRLLQEQLYSDGIESQRF
jgi:hypothetical protein